MHAMLIHVLAFAALVEAFEAPMVRVAQSAMKAAAPALVAGALAPTLGLSANFRKT